jgi:hypothetical protein
MGAYFNFLVDLHKNDHLMYALVSLALMMGAGVILSSVSSLVLNLLGIKLEKRRKEEF